MRHGVFCSLSVVKHRVCKYAERKAGIKHVDRCTVVGKQPRSRKTEATSMPRKLSGKWQIIISLALLYHLAALFLPPLSLTYRGLAMRGPMPPGPQMQQPSPLPEGVEEIAPPVEAEDEAASMAPVNALLEPITDFVRPYAQFVMIDKGYGFFSPDPDRASLIMKYRARKEDGSVVRGTFPDRSEHWPRLLYHRHFMLTSRHGELFDPKSGRGLPDAYLEHLQAEHNAQSVVLELWAHRISLPQEVLAGSDLDAKDTYRLLQTWRLGPAEVHK